MVRRLPSPTLCGVWCRLDGGRHRHLPLLRGILLGVIQHLLELPFRSADDGLYEIFEVLSPRLIPGLWAQDAPAAGRTTAALLDILD